MPTLHLSQNTIAKQSTAPASTLPRTAIANLPPGNRKIISYKPAANGHWSVALQAPIAAVEGAKTYQSWFVYADSVEISDDAGKIVAIAPGTINLPVPFFAQVAIASEPTLKSVFEQDRTCNTSSCAMCAKYLGANITGDDNYYFNYLKPQGDTTDHSAQTRALANLGIKSTWNTNLGYADLDQSLKQGKPAVIGILHRGTLANPRGGHMVVVVGRNAIGDYIFNDPYGNLLDGYTSAIENGQDVTYPRYVLDRRWLVDGQKAGWGRLFL
jgi:Peptidase_C39 like family